MEIFIICAIALIFGAIAGLLPGISINTVLIIFYPVLMHYDYITVFYIYLTLIVSIQYYGGISTIVFGIIGEVTEQPTVESGNKLFKQGYGNDILPAIASHSLVSSVLSLTILWLLLGNAETLFTFLSSTVKIILLVSALVMLLISGNSNKPLTLILIACGLFFGIIGSTILPDATKIVSNTILSQGLPFIPLLTGLIVIPALFEGITLPITATPTIMQMTVKDRLSKLLKITHLKSTVRGAIIGSITGMIPGVSYMISSTVAATVEKIIHANSSSANALTKNVLAAEAATKAGSIIVLVPLLFFWIPIVSSEAILLSIFDFQNLTYADWTNFLTHNVFYIITFILTLDLINWLISGYFYSYIVSAFHYLKLYGYYFLLLLVVGNIIYDGILDSSLSLNIYTMLVALVAGFYLKNNTHKMAFLFSFFISPRLLPEIYRWYLIHIV